MQRKRNSHSFLVKIQNGRITLEKILAAPKMLNIDVPYDQQFYS